MRDLYRNLGLDDQVDDPEMLRSQIAQCSHSEVASAARHILLEVKRKTVYDDTHRILKTIGRLRARLTLPRSYQWDALGNQDFDGETSGVVSRPCDWIDDLDPLGDIGIDVAAVRPGRQVRLLRAGWSWPLWKVLPLKTMSIAAALVLCLGLAMWAALGTARVPFPENGTEIRFDPRTADSRIQILTRPGLGHHHIQLLKAGTKQKVLSVFVRAGQSATVLVPPDNYQLRYAAGEKWYGTGHHFGSRVKYKTVPKPFILQAGKKKIIKLD